MEIFNTIIPIFAVIFIGWFSHRNGFFPTTFLEPANRIVFYFAIPAMIFRSISGASFSSNFDLQVLAIALAALTLAYLLAFVWGRMMKLEQGKLGTFIQSSCHSNIGYIALAVAFYYLGKEGLAATAMFAGFIMILQNLASVTALTIFSGQAKSEKGVVLRIFSKVMLNPTIISAGLGIVFSVFGLPQPVFISRTLDILGGMGLPTALLIIGASLSMGQIRSRLSVLSAACFFKLILLPGLAMGLFELFEVPGPQRLPILIMLASPTATVVYVMAGEMGGDTDFAASAISLCTVLSSGAFLLWLHAV